MRSGRGRATRRPLVQNVPDQPVGRKSDSGIESGSIVDRPNLYSAGPRGVNDVPRVPLISIPTANSGGIQKVDYTHKLPQSGDQGVKPEAEKHWPDMWHGEGDNPIHGVSPFSESGRFKILPDGTNIDLHKTQTFSFSGRCKVENVAVKEAEQDIARNLQLQGNFLKMPISIMIPESKKSIFSACVFLKKIILDFGNAIVVVNDARSYGEIVIIGYIEINCTVFVTQQQNINPHPITVCFNLKFVA